MSTSRMQGEHSTWGSGTSAAQNSHNTVTEQKKQQMAEK